MLVLSRHWDEKIIINGNIVITVVSIRGDKVRLGIEAPPDVRIDREEVYLERMEEQRQTSPRARAPIDHDVPPIDVSRRPPSLQEPPHGPRPRPRRQRP